jgi:hypothetical protein
VGVVLLLVSNVIFFILWITGAHPPAGAIGAVAGAAVSGVVAVALSVVASIDRQRDRRERERVMTEEHLVQSFQYFTGGSGGQQKRSVGISAVEGFSKEVPRLRGVFVPLLVNQVIYVLTKIPEGPQDEMLDNHEKDNLERMIDLLNQFRSSGDFAKYYAKLAEEIDRKISRMGERVRSFRNIAPDSDEATFADTVHWLVAQRHVAVGDAGKTTT